MDKKNTGLPALMSLNEYYNAYFRKTNGTLSNEHWQRANQPLTIPVDTVPNTKPEDQVTNIEYMEYQKTTVINRKSIIFALLKY